MEDIHKHGILYKKGAEANLYIINFLGLKAVAKHRIKKDYRDPLIDHYLRRKRTITESQILIKAKRYGIKVPDILYVDLKNNLIIMNFIEGKLLRDVLNQGLLSGIEEERVIMQVGVEIAKLHNINICHGDLTTSNIILSGNNNIPFLIDFGLGGINVRLEEKAVDLEMFYRVLESTHTTKYKSYFKYFMKSYLKHVSYSSLILNRFKDIRKRGRYVKR